MTIHTANAESVAVLPEPLVQDNSVKQRLLRPLRGFIWKEHLSNSR
jgi:hypothetical protein